MAEHLPQDLLEPLPPPTLTERMSLAEEDALARVPLPSQADDRDDDDKDDDGLDADAVTTRLEAHFAATRDA